MTNERDEAFQAFVQQKWRPLLLTAQLLTADRGRGEDLLQEALVKLWFAWPRIADQAPEAYVRRVLARSAARAAKRRWRSERTTDQLPHLSDTFDGDKQISDRDHLVRALAQLPKRQRVAVVLRYAEDADDDRIAEVLNCSRGNARVLAHRGLATLRGLLQETTYQPVL
ncbi:SigE family RNA polymerase sigma factor [Streptomyces sp. NPDC057909]|uniref:SigE family RNA polymerase sigma factor n=1 Tax=Streptomyces sp. NPDC057909 TaxID=3346277 RepID=UPI0036E4B011